MAQRTSEYVTPTLDAKDSMDAFIKFAALRFNLPPLDAQHLTLAICWLMKGSTENSELMHRLDPQLPRFLENPTLFLTAEGNPMGNRGASHELALLHLFSHLGLSLSHASGFTQLVLAWMVTELGVDPVRRMVSPVHVLMTLLTRVTRPSQALRMVGIG